MVTIEITAETAGEAADAVLMLTRGKLPSAGELLDLLEKTGIVADKVDERLVELKERGVFDRPTS